MNLNRKLRGLTLTELLIASILIAVVGAGAVAIDLSVRQMRQGSSRNTIVVLRTSALMAEITKFATLATGDLQNIGIADPGGLNQTVCARIENPAAGFPTPGNYSDDIGVCFTRINDNIHECRFNPWNTWSDCANADPVVGTVTTFQLTLPTTAIHYLELTLTDRFDHASPADSMANPSYTLTSRIVPANHSF